MCVLYHEEIPMQIEINYLKHTKLLYEDFDMSTIHNSNSKSEAGTKFILKYHTYYTWQIAVREMAKQSKISRAAKLNSP